MDIDQAAITIASQMAASSFWYGLWKGHVGKDPVVPGTFGEFVAKESYALAERLETERIRLQKVRDEELMRTRVSSPDQLGKINWDGLIR